MPCLHVQVLDWDIFCKMLWSTYLQHVRSQQTLTTIDFGVGILLAMMGYGGVASTISNAWVLKNTTWALVSKTHNHLLHHIPHPRMTSLEWHMVTYGVVITTIYHWLQLSWLMQRCAKCRMTTPHHHNFLHQSRIPKTCVLQVRNH